MDPRLTDAHTLGTLVLGEVTAQMQVFGQAFTDVALVVPRLQPSLYLLILCPLLLHLVVLYHITVQVDTLTVDQSLLTGQDARTDVVLLQQVAHHTGHLVVGSPRHDAHTAHALRILVPRTPSEVEEAADIVGAEPRRHTHGIGAYTGVNQCKPTCMVDDLSVFHCLFAHIDGKDIYNKVSTKGHSRIVKKIGEIIKTCYKIWLYPNYFVILHRVIIIVNEFRYYRYARFIW